jgi:hypothetical protein
MPKAITKEVFLQRVAQKFGDKFNLTLPEDFSLTKKIIINCPVHGDTVTTGRSLLHNSECGCKECGNDLRSRNSATAQRKPWLIRIDEFRAVHGNRYTYSQERGDGVKIKIKCDNHGEFEKHISAHLSGQGCPQCYYESTKAHKRKCSTKEEKEPTISKR